MLVGRAFTWHDDKNSLRVAIVNREFARKMFGSVKNAIGGHFKMPDGSRKEVVGIAQDGKYGGITEDPQIAMFLPIVQWPSNSNWLVVRSSRNPQQMGAAIRNTLHQLDAGLPVDIEKRYDEIRGALFPSQMATMSLGVMGVMLSITVPQNISYFAHDRLPLSVVFLFDLTETVQPILKPLAEGARNILSHLRPQDEVSVMVFSSHTELLKDFTTDRTLAA